MEIRAERTGDVAAIGAVTLAAFAGLPHSQQTEAAIVEALRAAGALTVSLVAVAGDVIGHAAISPVTIDGVARGWFGLGPVSVRPDRQRRGVGTALIDAGLDRLRKQGAAGCVVLGNPAYYGRFGFSAEPPLRYPGVPDGYFQALAFGAAPPAGTVAYHPGFAAR